MQLATYSCPHCLGTGVSPLLVIAEGEFGIWQCEHCDRAYRIRIEFRAIAETDLQRVREQFDPTVKMWQEPVSPEEADEIRAERIAARLLEVDREIRRLRDTIGQLQQEATALEHEQQSD